MLRSIAALFAICLFAGPAAAEPPHIAVSAPLKYLGRDFCWFHPRVAAAPGLGKEGGPAVIMTLQQHLAASDHYSGLYTMRTDDMGRTWQGPTENPELAWVDEGGDVTVAVADVTPGWHAPTGKLIAIGARVRYAPTGEQLDDKPRSNQTSYAVHDPATGRWSSWKIFEMPPGERFNFARSACAQWLVEPDGTLLVPFYFGESAAAPAQITVVRCRFDGETLTYVEHGDEIASPAAPGLYEPSIVRCGGRYFLTIRNLDIGYVTAGDDGLHYPPLAPWTFDDGGELGNYNTQQHWLVDGDNLYLAYTRRGANNDHIFRHRAPLFLAQVDRDRLCVIRATEQVLIPERGAPLGNFGAAQVGDHEWWVTDAEYILDDKPHANGADGSVFVSKVVFPQD